MIRLDREGTIAVVRLDAPPLNLLGSKMIALLRDAFESLHDDPPRCVVLFCSGGGADVKEMAEFTVDSARSFITSLHLACRAIRDLDAPVIAAIDGPCMGAHLEVAAACDMRIASHGSKLGMPEIRVGIPSVIDGWWIMRICGIGAASSLFFDGWPVDGAEAARIGLVNRLAASLQSEALDWARDIARSSQPALAAQKRVMRDWTDAEYERCAAASIERLIEAIEQGEAREAMHAMLEKRRPSFKGDV